MVYWRAFPTRNFSAPLLYGCKHFQGLSIRSKIEWINHSPTQVLNAKWEKSHFFSFIQMHSVVNCWKMESFQSFLTWKSPKCLSFPNCANAFSIFFKVQTFQKEKPGLELTGTGRFYLFFGTKNFLASAINGPFFH